MSGAIKAGLERARAPIDDMDVAVAAIAPAHGAVVTTSLAHFAPIEDLACRHWR